VSIESVLAYPPPQTTVVVQNMTKSVLVIASDPHRTHEVTFGSKNATDGSDYQHMPPEIIRTPAFARQISLGTLRVVEGENDPAVQSALKHQSDAYWKRAEDDAREAMATLDETADNDFVVLQCFGPGNREGAVCGENIPVKAADKESSPPLCDRHQHLVDRCIRRGTGPWVLERN
jgi:hypothetical protein